MNDLTPQQPHYSGSSALTVELAKMLVLVAPISMSTEQQELWLRAAVDALQDIRADEVQKISAEIRRSVSRPSQIVPEIANRVAELRSQRAKAATPAPRPLPPLPPRAPSPRLAPDEIAKMPKWMREMGVRVGFLKSVDGRLVDCS